MGPTSEAKWEGWSEAEGLWRESSRTPGGRVDIRSAEEQPYPGGSVADSAGKAVGWPDADQGANQGEDQGEDQGADQNADQDADQGADQSADQGANQGADQRCEPGCGPWRRPAGAGRK